MLPSAAIVAIVIVLVALYVATSIGSEEYKNRRARERYLNALLQPKPKDYMRNKALDAAEEEWRNDKKPTVVVTAQLYDAIIVNGYLVGYVQDDKRGRFTDGTLIVTSRVQDMKGNDPRIYHTENSIYYVQSWNDNPDMFTKLLLNEAVGSYNRSVIYKDM